jgi:hypothetical protein
VTSSLRLCAARRAASAAAMAASHCPTDDSCAWSRLASTNAASPSTPNGMSPSPPRRSDSSRRTPRALRLLRRGLSQRSDLVVTLVRGEEGCLGRRDGSRARRTECHPRRHGAATRAGERPAEGSRRSARIVGKDPRVILLRLVGPRQRRLAALFGRRSHRLAMGRTRHRRARRTECHPRRHGAATRAGERPAEGSRRSEIGKDPRVILLRLVGPRQRRLAALFGRRSHRLVPSWSESDPRLWSRSSSRLSPLNRVCRTRSPSSRVTSLDLERREIGKDPRVILLRLVGPRQRRLAALFGRVTLAATAQRLEQENAQLKEAAEAHESSVGQWLAAIRALRRLPSAGRSPARVAAPWRRG